MDLSGTFEDFSILIGTKAERDTTKRAMTNYNDISTITVFIIILRGIMFETKRPCLTTELS